MINAVLAVRIHSEGVSANDFAYEMMRIQSHASEAAERGPHSTTRQKEKSREYTIRFSYITHTSGRIERLLAYPSNSGLAAGRGGEVDETLAPKVVCSACHNRAGN